MGKNEAAPDDSGEHPRGLIPCDLKLGDIVLFPLTLPIEARHAHEAALTSGATLELAVLV